MELDIISNDWFIQRQKHDNLSIETWFYPIDESFETIIHDSQSGIAIRGTEISTHF